MAEYQIFQSILPSEDDEFVDDSYGERELERLDYSELQSIAAEHESEEVHGRMGQSELIEKLEGLERV